MLELVELDLAPENTKGEMPRLVVCDAPPAEVAVEVAIKLNGGTEEAELLADEEAMIPNCS